MFCDSIDFRPEPLLHSGIQETVVSEVFPNSVPDARIEDLA